MSFDFRVETDFFDHPKTDELRERLGQGSPECLLRLWAYAAQYRPDGDLTGLSDEAIEAKARWFGKPGDFIKAMLDLKAGRWLDGQKLRRHLHDWRTHQPWVTGRVARKAAAKEAARIRWEKEHAERIDSALPTALPSAIPPNTQHTPASPSKPQQAQTQGAGVWVTTQEAKELCEQRGWNWPTEQKLKTKREVESVYPCDRETFLAAFAETEKRDPVNAANYLSGTIKSMRKQTKPQKDPRVGWHGGSTEFQNGEVKL